MKLKRKYRKIDYASKFVLMLFFAVIFGSLAGYIILVSGIKEGDTFDTYNVTFTILVFGSMFLALIVGLVVSAFLVSIVLTVFRLTTFQEALLLMFKNKHPDNWVNRY